MFTTQCASCKDSVGQGPVCASCGNTFHFHCSGTTERGFNRLGSNRGSWKCIPCRDESSLLDVSAAPSTSHTPARLSAAALEDIPHIRDPVKTAAVEETTGSEVLKSIFAKLTELQTQLSAITSIKSDIAQVKNDLTDLKITLNTKCDELQGQVCTIEDKIAELEQCKSELRDLKTELKGIHSALSINEQQRFLKDIEITGVTEHPNENLPHTAATLASALGVKLDPRDLDDIRRVGPKGGKSGKDDRPRPVIITFTRREARDQILRAAKARRGLTTDKIEIPGNSRKIFINEHLTKENRILFSKARTASSNLKFKYVWTNNGNIFLRRSDTSSILRVTSELTLQKLQRNSSNIPNDGIPVGACGV